MAKQRRKRAADASAFSEGAKVEGLEQLEKVTNSVASGNAAKGIGHNSGGITDDELKRQIEHCVSLYSDVIAAKKVFDSANGAWRAALDIAKEKGAPKKELVEYIQTKQQRKDTGDGPIVTHQRNMARLMRVMGDPLYTQWKLFDDEPDTTGTKAERKAPAGMDAELQGQHCFHNQEPLANNPFIQGTEDFVLFEQGWKNAERALSAPDVSHTAEAAAAA